MIRKCAKPLLALGLLLQASAAWSAPKAITLPAIFQNKEPTKIDLPDKSARCPIAISSISDSRMDPTVIGVVAKQPIYAPENLEAWRNSIIYALNSRGIEIFYPSKNEILNGAVKAEFVLVRAWVTSVHNDFASSVMFNMKAVTPDGKLIDAAFRGGSTSGLFGGLVESVEKSISRALDAMAVDLLKLCGVSAKVD